MKSRKCLLSKSAGTTWGVSPSNLRTQLCDSTVLLPGQDPPKPSWSTATKYCNFTWLISSKQQPMQLSLLPVHANVTPSKLWRKASSDVFPDKVLTHPAWPLYANILNHPPQCLVSQRAIWLLQYCPTWVRRGLILGSQMQWSLMINPTIRRPTTWFQSHQTRCAPNRFCTGKGSGASNWHNTRSKCPDTHGGLQRLYSNTHSSCQQRYCKMAATNCYERNHETKKTKHLLLSLSIKVS